MLQTTAKGLRHERAIQHALRILQSPQYQKYVEAVYLFGSCARGTHKYSSDVDLLVQHTPDLKPQDARMLRIAIMPEQFDMPEIDVKFVSSDRWKKSNDPFSKNLVKEGKLLWKKK